MTMTLRGTLTLVCLALAGCTTGQGPQGPFYMGRTQQGALWGGGLGGLGGGILGHQKGRAWEGAAIGAGAGALIGALFGNSLDQREMRRSMYEQTLMQGPYPPYQAAPVDSMNSSARMVPHPHGGMIQIRLLQDRGMWMDTETGRYFAAYPSDQELLQARGL